MVNPSGVCRSTSTKNCTEFIASACVLFGCHSIVLVTLKLSLHTIFAPHITHCRAFNCKMHSCVHVFWSTLHTAAVSFYLISSCRTVMVVTTHQCKITHHFSFFTFSYSRTSKLFFRLFVLFCNRIPAPQC